MPAYERQRNMKVPAQASQMSTTTNDQCAKSLSDTVDCDGHDDCGDIDVFDIDSQLEHSGPDSCLPTTTDPKHTCVICAVQRNYRQRTAVAAAWP